MTGSLGFILFVTVFILSLLSKHARMQNENINHSLLLNLRLKCQGYLMFAQNMLILFFSENVLKEGIIYFSGIEANGGNLQLFILIFCYEFLKFYYFRQ